MLQVCCKNNYERVLYAEAFLFSLRYPQDFKLPTSRRGTLYLVCTNSNNEYRYDLRIVVYQVCTSSFRPMTMGTLVFIKRSNSKDARRNIQYRLLWAWFFKKKFQIRNFGKNTKNLFLGRCWAQIGSRKTPRIHLIRSGEIAYPR